MSKLSYPIITLGAGVSILFCLAVGVVYGDRGTPPLAQVVGADEMIASAKETGRWEPVALAVIVIAIVTLFVAVITYLIRDASKREMRMSDRISHLEDTIQKRDEADKIFLAEHSKNQTQFQQKLTEVLQANAIAFGEAREASRAVVASSQELTRRLEAFTVSRPCLAWHLVDGKWIPRDDFVTGNA